MKTTLVCLGFVIAASSAAIQVSLAQAHLSTAPQIASVHDEWVKDWNSKNLDGLVSLYAEDAALLTATGQRIAGQDAIRAYLKQAMDSSSSDLIATSINTDNSGELSYDSGTFLFTRLSGGVTVSGSVAISGNVTTSGGGSHRVRGNYLNVLKRNTHDKWLIVQQASVESQNP